MPKVIQVPTAIHFLENSHAYDYQGAYVNSELKSSCFEFPAQKQYQHLMGRCKKEPVVHNKKKQQF